MTTENKGMKIQATGDTYRFRNGRCSITLKFANEETAPTVEEVLEKILMGRID